MSETARTVYKIAKSKVSSTLKNVASRFELSTQTLHPLNTLSQSSFIPLKTFRSQEALTSTSMAAITTFVNDLMERNPSKRTAFIKSGAANYHQQS